MSLEKIDIYSVIVNFSKLIDGNEIQDVTKRVFHLHFKRAIENVFIKNRVTRIYLKITEYRAFTFEDFVKYLAWLCIDPNADKTKSLWQKLVEMTDEDVKKAVYQFSVEGIRKKNIPNLTALNNERKLKNQKQIGEEIFEIDSSKGASLAYLWFTKGYLTPRIFITPRGRKALTEKQEHVILIDEYRTFVRIMNAIKPFLQGEK